MFEQINNPSLALGKGYADTFVKAQGLALAGLERITELNLKAFEAQVKASVDFWSEAAEVRDFEGVKAIWPKGVALAKESAEKLYANGQEVAGVSAKTSEAIGTLAKGSFENTSETISQAGQCRQEGRRRPLSFSFPRERRGHDLPYRDCACFEAGRKSGLFFAGHGGSVCRDCRSKSRRGHEWPVRRSIGVPDADGHFPLPPLPCGSEMQEQIPALSQMAGITGTSAHQTPTNISHVTVGGNCRSKFRDGHAQRGCDNMSRNAARQQSRGLEPAPPRPQHPI